MMTPGQIEWVKGLETKLERQDAAIRKLAGALCIAGGPVTQNVEQVIFDILNGKEVSQ